LRCNQHLTFILIQAQLASTQESSSPPPWYLTAPKSDTIKFRIQKRRRIEKRKRKG
jgi:hypothetical protein